MKKVKSMLALTLCLAMCVGCGSTVNESKTNTSAETESKQTSEQVGDSNQSNTSNDSEKTESEEVIIPGIDATELVQDITIGWNLGNDLECCSGKAYDEFTISGSEKVKAIETSWGSPAATHEVITAVKNAGFTAIRIPVTYRNFINDNGVIDIAWLERIKEVVDWSRAEGLYVIINVHHDTGKDGWLRAEASNYEANKELFAKLWIQIADYFQDYDEHLIFEGFNEILDDEGEWWNPSAEELQAVNDYNQLFVDTIRGANGFNPYRCLVCNTYAANAGDTVINGFLLPEDTVANRLIVSVHEYEGVESFDKALERMDKAFLSKGIPCIIGEMGMTNKDGRESYAKSVLSYAKEKGIPCFWWDDVATSDNASDIKNYALMNRRNANWVFTDLLNTMMEAVQ